MHLYWGDPLVNSTWTCKVGHGFIDTLKFKKNNHVTNYECEMHYTFHGSYKISKDTLIVEEKDDSRSEDNGKAKFSRIRYLIQGNYLYPINRSELDKGKWKDSGFKFDKSYFFKRTIH
jgi:hypothetical protein